MKQYFINVCYGDELEFCHAESQAVYSLARHLAFVYDKNSPSEYNHTIKVCNGVARVLDLTEKAEAVLPWLNKLDGVELGRKIHEITYKKPMLEHKYQELKFYAD